MKSRLWWVLALVSLSVSGIAPQTVWATKIQYEMVMTVTTLFDPDGLLTGLIEPTDAFHMAVTLDQSTKTPADPPPGAEYIAGLPTHSAAFQFGSVYGVFAGTNTINGFVDNNNSLGRDVFFAGLGGFDPPPANAATGGSSLDPTFTLDEMRFSFSMEDDQATALTSNDLPLSIDVSQWERRPFSFDGFASRDGVGSGIFGIQGDIADVVTTVIPVPPALYLFGSGLLGLVGIARRKKA